MEHGMQNMTIDLVYWRKLWVFDVCSMNLVTNNFHAARYDGPN